jgi:hypothetical protein
MTPHSFTTSFVDPYLSTDPSSAAFFGGLGFVIHTSNTTRLTCANFEMVGGANGTSSNATSTGNMTMPSATGTPEFPGSAAKSGAGFGVVLMAIVISLLL